LLVNSRDEALGAAEYRCAGDAVFLNHIALARAIRGRGWGRELLRESSKAILSIFPASAFLLDVEPGNTLASDWYRRLGFEPVGQSFWLVGSTLSTQAGRGKVIAWDAAQRDHRRFGFSSFRIETAQGCHEVGKLGRRYFLLDGAAAWSDPSLHASLAHLRSKRSLLVRSDGILPGLTLAHQTIRMKADARQVLARLER
jgi:hypothetical protein